MTEVLSTAALPGSACMYAAGTDCLLRKAVDDSVITTKVKSLIAADDFLKSFDISVETYKGIVQLSGFVDSQKALTKAGQIARSVKGVGDVKNNLIVK